MKHKENSMKVNISKPNEVWCVDSGASNHMMNHEEWFSHLEKQEQTRVVETIDDTSHPIEHIGDVSFSHVGQIGRLVNVLHVPKITNNLVCLSDRLSTKGCRSGSPI